MKLSELIKNEVKKHTNAIDFTSQKVFVSNLIFMYQIMIASERLLKEAADESDGYLRDYYLRHLEEERGHAEWLSDDLKTVGIDVNGIDLLHQAAALAGTQYYLIKLVHPASLLGYMAVLEGNPVGMDFVNQMEYLHGKDLCRTLRYHAENDVEHKKELFAMLDLSSHPSIMMNANQTALYLNELAKNLEGII